MSTSIPRLLAEGASTEFDEAGFAVFLRLGFFIGEDTPFRTIRAVPPDTIFEWKNGELHVSGRLALGKLQYLRRNQATDLYISLFKAAIQRRLPADEAFAVSLSGGRDSRHILLELCDSGYYPKFCVTARLYSPWPNRDAEIASKLAKSLRLKHVVLNQPKSRIQAELRKNERTNFCADEHAWLVVMADYLKGKVDTLYDGIGGDVLSAGLFLTEQRLALFDCGRLSDLAKHLLSQREASLAHLLVTEQYRRFGYDLAVNHLTRELEKHAEAPNPVGSFYFWNRTRREIALSPYCLLSEVGNIFSPYLDHDLYDFLASLPASLFLDHKFHTDAIRLGYPDYADIPYELGGTNQVEDYSHSRAFALELIGNVFHNLSSQLVSNSFLIPRLCRCLLDKTYSASINWFGPLVLYLLQIERFMQTGSIRPNIQDKLHWL